MPRTSGSLRSLNTWMQRRLDDAIGFTSELVRGPPRSYVAQVSPELWRGSEPDVLTLVRLRREGVRAVLDLRCSTGLERTRAEAVGLKYFNVPILDGRSPTPQALDALRAVFRDPANRPIYVHCREGVGRTGIAVAWYQLCALGRPLDAVLADAKRFGMRMRNQERFIRRLPRS